MSLEESTERIMERVRQRKMELCDNDDSKENVNSGSVEAVSNKVFFERKITNDVSNNELKTPLAPPPPIESESTNETSASKSTFAALAEDIDNFICSPQKEKPKEAFLKGRSPRLSIGETRSSVLCTPAGFNQMRSPSKSILTESNHNQNLNKTNSPGRLSLGEEKRIRFAHPIAATSTFVDESSITYSQTESSNVTSVLSDSTLSVPPTSTPLADDECGAHTFMRKKTPTKSDSSSSLKICSPKPFVRGGSASHFSPVQFNPINTSSPKVQESSISIFKTITTEIDVGERKLNSVQNRRDFVDELEKTAKFASSSPRSTINSTSGGNTLSPARSVAIENAKAKTIAQQLEQKLKGAPVTVPTPKPLVSSSVVARDQTPKTDSSPIKTQWRGATGTPVVAGRDPAEPTKPDVRASNLKTLKNRWEFSSLTGTPIHPDESEDSLVRTAIRIRDTTIPPKINFQKTPVAATTPLNERKTYATSELNSPCMKSPRYAVDLPPERSPSPLPQEQPEALQEESMIDNEESMNEFDCGTNVSRFIDDAFDFMKYSPNKSLRDYPQTPNREAPLAAMEKTPDFLSMDTEDTGKRNIFERKNEETEIMETAVSREATSDSSGTGSRLPYTISFYRKRGKMQDNEDCEKINLNAVSSLTPGQQIIGGTILEEDDEEVEQLIKRMDQEIKVQIVRIQQASRALEHCRQKEEFRGSREEVTAQRALLLAGETRHALQAEIEKLQRGPRTLCVGPRGALVIRSIKVHVNRDFVASANSALSSTSSPIYYFCVLLRVGEQVHATSIITSDECLKKKDCYVEFTNTIELKPLSPDFVCSIEVYALRGHREQFSHEEKYHLRGTHGRNKTLPRSGIHFSSGGPGAIHDTSFNRLGRTSFDINVRCGQTILHLQDSVYPLEGSIAMRAEKRAVSRTNATHRGFLSMFQRTKEGLGSWNRYWCVLESGEMKFWRCPEDESNSEKSWLVLLDLQTCAGEGASTIRETCPYPNSFHIDVWVPKEIQCPSKRGSPEMEKLRVMLAADTKPDMNVWIDAINTTTLNLLMWQKPISG